MLVLPATVLLFSAFLPQTAAHIAMFHPSMFGFNSTDKDPIPPDSGYPLGNNRAVNPLFNLPFKSWWFHGFLDQPPHPEDIMQLPAGGKQTLELTCHKGATSFAGTGGESPPGSKSFADGTPCPKAPTAQFHALDIQPQNLGGCALAIAYKSDAKQVKPEDFAVFSVNHKCVEKQLTDFEIPAKMPPCPNGKCTCAWFWVHRENSGGEEIYMNGFQCNIANSTSKVAIPAPKVPKKCADDPNATADQTKDCVVGPKQPLYWLQKEGNNMFEDSQHPPLYRDQYGFRDGAQNDLWDGLPSGSSAGSVSAATPSKPASAPRVSGFVTSFTAAQTSSRTATSSASEATQTTAPRLQSRRSSAKRSEWRFKKIAKAFTYIEME